MSDSPAPVVVSDRTRPRNAARARRLRWFIPPAVAAVAAAATILPQAATGAEHPTLPTLTAAQVLTDLADAKVPNFTGTVVATARLGLPALPSLAGSSGGGQLAQLETLLTGSHTVKLAYAGPSRQRVSVIMSDLSESDVVHDGRDLWTYTSSGNAVTHTVLPASAADRPQPGGQTGGVAPTPQAAAQDALSALRPSTAVTVDTTARVAGRPAYQLVLSPRDPGSLVRSVRIAMDSTTHLPLRVQVWSTSDPATPAFEVGFTDLHLRTPAASTFAFSVPPGATVTTPGRSAEPADGGQAAPAGAAAVAPTVVGRDWTSVLAGRLKAGTPSKTSGGAELDAVLTRVAGGRELRTALVTVLVTDDNRYLVGAVTPALLEHLASQGAGR